jgi:predicted Zn-dependent protease
MTCARGLMAVLLLGAGATTAPAQLVIGLSPPGLTGFTVGRTGFGGYFGRRLWQSAYLSGGWPLGAYGSLSSPYWGAPFSQTTIVLSSPPTTPVVINQPITIVNNQQAAPPAPEGVVVRPRHELLVDRREQERKGIFAPQREEIAAPEAPPDEPPLPGQPAGRFRKVNPEDRARAAQAPREPLPQPRPPRDAAQQPPPAEETPDAETARHIAQGKEAFAAQQYGLAARRFRQATVSGPKDPLAHFLLAQARFALGKYAEAVASIQTGMRLRPDWPSAQFRPSELYGQHADDFKQQVLFLQDTLAQAPQDPVLLLLLAYELWFDGRRDEAVPLFQRAAVTAPDKTFINAFLRVQ